MTEKEFAKEIKKEFFYNYYNYKDFACLGYPWNNIPVDNLNLDKLKVELKNFNLNVDKGCDLKHISKYYLNQWEKSNSIIVYANECDL